LNWKIGLVMIITWLVVLALFRISSVASLVSLALVPIFASFWQSEYFLILLILFGLALLRHRANIERLRKGEEKPIRFFVRNKEKDGG